MADESTAAPDRQTISRRRVLQATAGTALCGTLAGKTAATATQSSASGQTLYVGSNDQTLYALDTESGEQEWAFTEPADRVDWSPTVVNGTVYIGSVKLYAVDAASGEQEWAFTEPSEILFSAPTVTEETLYIGSTSGGLYAIDTESGEQEWLFAETDRGIYSAVSVFDGVVYFGTRGERVYAVDAESGEQEWLFSEIGSPILSSPTVADGTLYVGSLGVPEPGERYQEAGLFAIDAASGEQEWVYTGVTGSIESSPTVAGGTVYVGSTIVELDDQANAVGNDGEFYAVDAESGEQEWLFSEPSNWVASSPTVVGETVYVGSNDQTLYALDTESGEQQWTFTGAGEGIRSSPTVVNDPVEGSSIDSRVGLWTLGHHEGTHPLYDQSADETPADDDSSTGDDSNSGTPAEVDDGTDEPSPAETAESDDGSGPGFGIASALTGLSGAGYMLKRRVSADTDESDAQLR